MDLLKKWRQTKPKIQIVVHVTCKLQMVFNLHFVLLFFLGWVGNHLHTGVPQGHPTSKT